MRADITITNIPTIMGIMDVMVITHRLDLATVTVGAIMVAVLGAFMAGGVEVVFTVVIDKTGKIDE